MTITAKDRMFLQKAFELADEAEAEGNLPIGALITFKDEIIATGKNTVFEDGLYNPIGHAEKNALHNIPARYTDPAIRKLLTLYTNLEPCAMCTTTTMTAKIGRVVFGARDLYGLGGQQLVEGQLKQMYSHRAQQTVFEGPTMSDKEAIGLHQRIDSRYHEQNRIENIIDLDKPAISY